MLSVEAEPQIHHTSEQMWCVYYFIFSLFVLLTLWHLGLWHLREGLPLLVLLYYRNSNSSLPESMGFSYVNESTQASPLLIYLCLWQISPSTPTLPAPGPDPNQLDSLSVYSLLSSLLTLPCLDFPVEKTTELVPTFFSSVSWLNLIIPYVTPVFRDNFS